MTAEGIRFVFLTSDRREDAAVSEAPFLDLRVLALDVLTELREIREEPLLHDSEPGVARIGVRVDAAQLDEVVLHFLDDECLDETPGFLPVRLLAGLQRHELDGEPGLLRARKGTGGRLRQALVLLSSERVLELMIG